jgi:glycine dehydrogenase subunit 2
MIRKYHHERGDTKRTKILVPNSAHGTNPASVTMAGFQAVELPSDANGDVDLTALRAACDDMVAGMMITVPSTLGLFERHILDVIKAVHDCGGLMYMDGANMNAHGAVKPGELGFDDALQPAKNFSTPHGGAPGCGAVGVGDVKPYLPPVVIVEDRRGRAALRLRMPEVYRALAFWELNAHPRYAYIRIYGGAGRKSPAMPS